MSYWRPFRWCSDRLAQPRQPVFQSLAEALGLPGRPQGRDQRLKKSPDGFMYTCQLMLLQIHRLPRPAAIPSISPLSHQFQAAPSRAFLLFPSNKKNTKKGMAF